MMLALPMCALYELGIIAARVLARRSATGAPDSNTAG